MKKLALKDRFAELANEYILKFEKKHEYEFDFWIADEIRIASFIQQYFFNFDDIRFDIDNNCPKGMIFEWQDYIIEDSLPFENTKYKDISFENYSNGKR